MGNVVETVLCCIRKWPDPIVFADGRYSINITASHIVKGFNDNALSHSNMIQTISGLSILDLILLVSMYRVSSRRTRDKTCFNFESAHYEFRKYCDSGNHVDRYSKQAAIRSFERLLDLGIVAPADSRAATAVWGSGSGAHAGVYVADLKKYAGLELQVVGEEIRRDWRGIGIVLLQ